MTGKTYSAGTIFLQVAPVFKDVMDSIRRNAKDWDRALGDELEKSGEQAGKRANTAIERELSKGAKEGGRRAGRDYAGAFDEEFRNGVNKVGKELEPIKIKVERNELRREFAEIKREISSLGDAKVGVDIDAKDAYAQLLILKARLSGLQSDAKTIDVKVNLDEAQKGLDRFIKRVQSSLPNIDIPVRVDTTVAERKLSAFERKFRDTARSAAADLGDLSGSIHEVARELDDLSNTEIGIDLSDEAALRKLRELQARLAVLAAEEPSVEVEVSIAAALAKLAVLEKAIEYEDGRTVKVDVDTKGVESGITKFAAFNALLALFNGRASAGAANGQAVANSFRAFNGILLAAVTILPAIVPALAAVGGGLAALIPILGAVGAGIGTLVIGFSGIGNALSAMSARDDSTAKDTLTASRTIRAALQQVQDAQEALARAEQAAGWASADAARAVAQAKEQAAQQIRSALEQQGQAQEQYKNSVEDVRNAERDLADARYQAAVAAQTLNDSVAQNQIDIGQATLSVAEAQNTYNTALANGSATPQDREAALLALQQAELRLKELREAQANLAHDKKKQDKEGINGSDQVRSAEQQLTRAIQAQRDAERGVADAARALRKAQIDGARAVADAERNANRVAITNAQSIADAQKNLARAQQNYQDALTKTGDIGSANQLKVKQAMAALSPEGRRFARFIYGLKQGWYDFRDAVQASLLPPVQKAIQEFITKYGPMMTIFAARMAGVMGGLFLAFERSLSSPAVQKLFLSMAQYGPELLEKAGRVAIRFFKVIAALIAPLAPYSVQLEDAFLRIGKSVLQWAQSKSGADTIRHFMDYAFKVGPKVAAFFWDLFLAVVAIGRALAPWGEKVLTVLDSMLVWIAGMDTKKLGRIATAVIGLIAAFQAANLSVFLLGGGFRALGTPLGLTIFLITTISGLLLSLGVPAKVLLRLGEVLLGVFTAVKIGMAVYKAYNAIIAAYGVVAGILVGENEAVGVSFLAAYAVPLLIIAVIAAVIIALVELYRHNKTFHDFVLKAWAEIKKIGLEVWGAIKDAFWATVHALEDAYRYMLPTFQAIGAVFYWLWKHVVKPVLGFIADYFKAEFSVIKIYWQRVLWPVLDLIAHVIWMLWRDYFKVALILIVGAWKVMVAAIKIYWRTYLHPILSLFGVVITDLWKVFVKPAIDKIASLWSLFSLGFQTVWKTVIHPAISAFKSAIGELKSKFDEVMPYLATAWDGLKKIFAVPVKFVVDTVLNNGLIAGFNKVADFVGSTKMQPIQLPKSIENAYATGGILPGYTPGRDVHHYYSPTGGRLDLSGGEAIMRPEVTRAAGSGWVNRLNYAARVGGVDAVRKLLNGGTGHFFANGGIVQSFARGGVLKDPDSPVWVNGEKIAAIFAAQMGVAMRLGKRAWSLIQGGYADQAHYSGSGGSHNYPGVGDIGRAGLDFSDQYWARRVGLLGWARNIPGAAYAGSGAHVHALSMFSPGTRVSPQYGAYFAGQDGLGGADYGPRPKIIPNILDLLSGFNIGDLSNLGAGAKAVDPLAAFPDWLISVAKNPVTYLTDLVKKPVKAMEHRFGSSDMIKGMAALPGQLIKDTAHKMVGIMPSPLKGLDGLAHDALSAGEGAAHAIGHALGLAKGGIIPYNGVMKYDSGGMLPPGLTSVVNLTGRPEPVFTPAQLDRVSGGPGGGFTYAPTFNQSDLTAADLFEEADRERRKINREGLRYRRSHPS